MHDFDAFPYSMGWRVKLQCNSSERRLMGMGLKCYEGPNRDSQGKAEFVSLVPLFKKIFIFISCVCVCVAVSDPPELELQTVVSCHVGAGN